MGAFLQQFLRGARIDFTPTIVIRAFEEEGLATKKGSVLLKENNNI
jgi:hypothetical protein